MSRETVTFRSHGLTCSAWWFPPADPPAPTVVMAHGFGATRDARLDAYAERFQEAGFGVLVFDYRHFGDSEGEPRQLVDIDRQLEDWHAALAYVRSRSDVDTNRIAIWGTSFSGGHVLAVAARDPDVAAVISQVPFIDGMASLKAFGIGPSLRITAVGLRDGIHALLGMDPYCIPIVGPPGTLAGMTTPDAEPGYKALLPPDTKWQNEVPARIFLRLGLYRPGQNAERIRCPLLLCVADQDALTPPEPAVEVSRRAPQGEALRYDLGHFDIYVGEPWEKAVRDQAAFLKRHLSREKPSAAGAAG